MNEHDATSCSTICTFSFGEKLLVRSTFYGAAAVGAYGIWQVNASAAWLYATFVAVSYFLLMRYSVCARCPHVFVAGDCLFVPAPLVKLFVAPRSGHLTIWEGAAAAVAVFGTIIIPLYWLVGYPLLLVVFIALTAVYLIGLVGRICKKCQVEVCPLNRNTLFD